MKKIALAGAILAALSTTAFAAVDGSINQAKRGPIANSYIVTINLEAAKKQYGKSDTRGVADAMLKEVGNGNLKHVYERALQGFSVNITEAQANALRRNKNVIRIDQDQHTAIAATQSSAPWGLDRIDQVSGLNGQFVYPDAAGNASHVYVLDTGIRSTHVEFTGRISTGRNFIANEDGLVTATNTNDCNGHGTHVAGTTSGTTYGVAKKSIVHPVRVLGCDGGGSVSAAIAGIDWVIGEVNSMRSSGQAWPAVINMSLSSSFYQPFNDAAKKAVSNGIVVVAAGGNNNSLACDLSPASTPEVITVGATTSADARASFSNFGTCLDLFAPGQSILSSVQTGDTASAYYSGTSMAAPHVAGVVAHQLTKFPTAKPDQVAKLLTNESVLGLISDEGAGSPDRLLQMPNSASTLPPSDVTEPVTPTAPCTSCVTYQVSGATGAIATLPSASGFAVNAMQLKGYLRMPSGMTGKIMLDLYNSKRRTWSTVLTSATGASIDSTYTAAKGTYRWRTQVVSGSGSYTFYGSPK